MITVFYDGQCGVCSKEIAYYKRIAKEGVFDWQDVVSAHEALNKAGITTVEALKYMHVQDDDGTIHRGVDAFIIMWSQMPQWIWLAKFVALPGVRGLATRLYDAFAKRRFNRLQHCQVALQKEQNKEEQP